MNYDNPFGWSALKIDLEKERVPVTISDRYRELTDEAGRLLRQLEADPEALPSEAKWLGQATETLDELSEGVGEIPRMRLESRLTPVLLRAHNRLDRARLLIEERGEEDCAASVWELEQRIYRLLNDL